MHELCKFDQKFEDEFGNIEVDLEQKILSLNLEENQVSNFTKEFQDLGFEIVERL